MLDPKTAEQYEKWGKTPPKSQDHGTDEEIARRMTKLLPHSWRLEGNKLIGETSMGTLVQYIPTDYILVGVEDGLPKLKKVAIT